MLRVDPFFTKIQTSELTLTRHMCFRKGLVIGRQSDLGFPKLQINIKASCAEPENIFKSLTYFARFQVCGI